MKARILLWIALGQFALPAFAALKKSDCNGPDFAEALGPVRDQTHDGWCWAFTTADLIGFYQRSVRVSAEDVAIAALSLPDQEGKKILTRVGGPSYYLKHSLFIAHDKALLDSEGNDLPLGRGFSEFSVDPILAYNRRTVICPESALPSEPKGSFLLREKEGDTPNDTEPPPSFFPHAKVALPDLGAEDTDFLAKSVKRLGGTGFQASAKVDPLADLTMSCAAGPSPIDPIFSGIAVYNRKVLEALNTSAEARCKGGPSLKPMRSQMAWFDPFRAPAASGGAASTQAAAWLREGQPLGFGYDSDFLTDSDWRKSAPNPDHVSVLAGMRWNGEAGRCEFRLRNDWDPGCKGYADEISARCEKGNLWITEEELDQNARVLFRVRDPAIPFK